MAEMIRTGWQAALLRCLSSLMGEVKAAVLDETRRSPHCSPPAKGKEMKVKSDRKDP
jgi:hypothetical protein